MINPMKTITNALKTYTDSKIVKSKANWNQNDPNADDYIKNRTHWEEEKEIVADYLKEYSFESIEHEGSYGTEATFDIFTIMPVLNETYSVNFDGVEYNCELKYNETIGTPYIGNASLAITDGTMENTTEPFFMALFESGTCIIVTEQLGNHTISICKHYTYINIHKINEKYLPELGSKVGQPGSGKYAEIFNDYNNNIASGKYSHAEGGVTTASGNYSHAEGFSTTASNQYSHAEGNSTTASGTYSHAEGTSTTASGICSHAEGYGTIARSNHSHAEGYGTKVTTDTTVTVSKVSSTSPGAYGHAEGYGTVVIGRCGHAEGNGTNASGHDSHSEGYGTIASGKCSHAEGYITTASGIDSHSEGYNTTAKNQYSHAEGYSTIASGSASHAEGSSTTASGTNSHAEGAVTTAGGKYSHAEGNGTVTTGQGSHAEGYNTSASGNYSHAEGRYTEASSDYQHVQGKYNIADTSSTYAHIVGNGTSDTARSNAYTLDWSGNGCFAGNVYVGGAVSGSGKKALSEYDFMKININHMPNENNTDKILSAAGTYDYLQIKDNEIFNYGIIIDTTTLSFEENGSLYVNRPNSYYKFIVGDKYKVVWDGVEYDNLIAYNLDDEINAIGDEKIYPFRMQTGYVNDIDIFTTIEGDHTFSLYHYINDEIPEVKQIKEEYLPNNNYKKNYFTLADTATGYNYIVEMNNGQLISYCTDITELIVTTLPTKTEYVIGESLDTTGMTVVATCADGSMREVTGWTIPNVPTANEGMYLMDFGIKYVENGVEYSIEEIGLYVTVTEAATTEETTE